MTGCPWAAKTTPYTAYRVARLEPGTLMLWDKPGGSWLWLLEPDGEGRTRLITRLRSRYAWAKPTIVTELILMEIGDPGKGPSAKAGWARAPRR